MKKIAMLLVFTATAWAMSAQEAFHDCSNAVVLCSNEPFSIEKIQSVPEGDPFNENTCWKEGFPTTNVVWFKWKVKSTGNLGFLLLPVDANDDLDFVLYRLDNGLDDCGSKTPLRCMASGENRGEDKADLSARCSGATGLSEGASDVAELPGCVASDDNFLSEIQAEAGEEYALWVNNYYSSKGFILEFTGSAQLAPIAAHCWDGDDVASETVELNDYADQGLLIGALFPNPTRQEINLPIVSSKPYSDGKWSLISQHGDILQMGALPVGAGQNNLNLSTAGLPVGVYFLKIILGDNTHVVRFIKS